MIIVFQELLDKQIEEYCKRHGYDLFEINYNQHYVAYLTHDEYIYDTFDYLKVDLCE